jgi:hypothetical protein
MPIVGGLPSSYVEVVRLKPIHHSKMRASLVKPCALDILTAVRSVDREALRSTVDCSVLETPSLDPLDKEMLLRPLGMKKLEVGFSARGLAGSARGSKLRLNLRT